MKKSCREMIALGWQKQFFCDIEKDNTLAKTLYLKSDITHEKVTMLPGKAVGILFYSPSAL